MKHFLFAIVEVLPLLLTAGNDWTAVIDSKITPKNISQYAGKTDQSLKFQMPVDGCDLDKITGKTMPSGSTALLMTTIDSEKECDADYLVNVDWWFQLYCNGKLIHDCWKNGSKIPITAAGHKVVLPLQKGKNAIAILAKRGTDSWFVYLHPAPDFSTISKDRQRCQVLLDWYFPPRKASLLGGPNVLRVTKNSARVSAVFEQKIGCGVRIRSAKEPVREIWALQDGKRVQHTHHGVDLTGLQPDTRYEVELLTADYTTEKINVVGKTAFRTFSNTIKPFSFIAFSDMQVRPFQRADFAKKIIGTDEFRKSDFYVSLGDMDTSIDVISDVYFKSFLNLFLESGTEKTFVALRGNHEYNGKENERFSDLFGRPYYAFRYNDTFFFVFDTGNFTPRLFGLDIVSYFDEQAQWVREVIATEDFKTAKHRIVLAHATPFYFESSYFMQGISNIAAPFLGKNPQYKLDLWLCGDIHSPYRYDPVTHQRIGLYDKKRSPGLTSRDTDNIQFPVYVNDGPFGGGSLLSVTYVEVDQDKITLTCINDELKIQDKVVLRPGKAIETIFTTYKPF